MDKTSDSKWLRGGSKLSQAHYLVHQSNKQSRLDFLLNGGELQSLCPNFKGEVYDSEILDVMDSGNGDDGAPFP